MLKGQSPDTQSIMGLGNEFIPQKSPWTQTPTLSFYQNLSFLVPGTMGLFRQPHRKTGGLPWKDTPRMSVGPADDPSISNETSYVLLESRLTGPMHKPFTHNPAVPLARSNSRNGHRHG